MVPEPDELLERVAQTLKEPVRIDPSFDRRVMSEIERLPTPGKFVPRVLSLFDWLGRRRTFSMSPLGGLAWAAAAAAVVLAASWLLRPGEAAAPALLAAGPEPTVIQFVLVAPEATTVTLVGDFNDWSASATPLARHEENGVWSVTVPLSPGRYRYSFLVNGTTWIEDPRGLPGLEDEFGRPNSVLTVGGA